MQTLSAYVGLRAIGWLLHNEKTIIQHGIKRLHVPFDNYYEYIAGQPVTKRINRRIKRQMRRNLWRYKSRRQNLQHYLQTHLANPLGPYSRTEMLELRIKALTEKLLPGQLAAVLMSLQTRRGYKSQRGVSDNDNSDYLKDIERHETNLLQYRSMAEYLLTLPSSKNIIFNRQSYINEFNAIMDTQALSNEMRNHIFGFIYYQNPLRKGKVAKCDYEKNREVMPGSHPMYQEFRIWRDVLNIKIWDSADNNLDISFNQRKLWVEKLMRGTHITKAACLKDLGIKKSSMYSWLSGKQIAGNPITGLFGKLSIPEEFTATLWQELYSATDTDKLRSFLTRKYNFSAIAIDDLCDADFSTLGHAEFSAKAVRKLLPHLQQGMKLKEAILHEYGKVDFAQVALRNIILEQHFDAYKSLVAGLKAKYSEIGNIKFEIDPLLKAGNKLRKAQASGKRKDEKFVKEHADKPLGHAGSYNAKKLRLWIESNGRSPYEPDVAIPLTELFTNKYNLDHLVPKSKLVEGGENNLVLCRTNLNEAKDNQFTGIEFAEYLGVAQGYQKIMEQMPEAKQGFMKMRMTEVPTNWISRRQCSDYNTKCFATVGNGLNIPNKIVHKYMALWNLPEYNDQDARRYLAAAYVVANFDQDSIAYFDNVQAVNGHVYSLTPALNVPDIAQAPISMQRIKFVRRTNHGFTPRFALHGESVHGQRSRKFRNNKGQWIEEKFYKIRQPISKLTPPMVEKIMDETLKQKIKARIAEAADHESGILSLVENPVLHDGNPVKRVSIAVNAESIYPLHSTDGHGHTGPKGKYPTPCDFVFSDKNQRLTITPAADGKQQRTTTPLMLFVDKLNAKQAATHHGFHLYERSIVELHGILYFVIGASESLALRPVYTLSATNTLRVKKEDWPKLKKILINQLGEVVKGIPVSAFIQDKNANF